MGIMFTRSMWWRQTGSNDDENSESHDWRAIEPEASCFPNPKGWKIGTKEVDLDKLNIKIMTHEHAMRKFVPPACEKVWASKLNAEISFKKVWKLKPTPRDRATGMKVLHRTLYLHREQKCLLCDEPESITHTCACVQYHRQYWDHLLDLATGLGEPRPVDTAVWVATGAISREKVMRKEVSSLWYIGWRCIYAEICQYRIEGGTFDPKRALKRAVAMIIGRAKAHGKKWGRWYDTGQYIKEPRFLAERYRKKVLMDFDEEANYAISSRLLAEARKLNLI